MMRVVVVVLWIMRWCFGSRWVHGLNWRLWLCAAIYNLVELATVKPYTATIWAIVDLYAAAFSNEEGCVIVWTLHCIYYTPPGSAMIVI